MDKIFWIAIVLFDILLTGFLAIIFIIIKNILEKQNAYTKKLNTIFNCILLFTFLGLLLFAFVMQDYRTPSIKRFEKNTGLKIKGEYKVLKDVFEATWQDYSLDYEIELREETSRNLTEQLELKTKSKEINKSFYKILSNQWYKENERYYVHATVNRTHYSISYDMQTKVLTYSELGN